MGGEHSPNEDDQKNQEDESRLCAEADVEGVILGQYICQTEKGEEAYPGRIRDPSSVIHF